MINLLSACVNMDLLKAAMQQQHSKQANVISLKSRWCMSNLRRQNTELPPACFAVQKVHPAATVSHQNPQTLLLLVKSDPGESTSGKKGKPIATFTHHKATCTGKHINMIPLDIQQHFWNFNLKSFPFLFCFSIYVAPRNRCPQYHLSFDAFLWKMLQCYGNWILSILLLNVGAVYQKRWKKPSVVFLHSAWRLWRWHSSAANASQRAGFYRQLSKIFMSAARAELKRRIFCATIRERWASLSHSSRLQSSVTLFSDDFAA